MSSGTGNAWTVDPREDRTRGVLLLGFPHAGGGGGLFRPWRAQLAPHIDVHPVVLPGREKRLNETPYVRMDDAVDGLMAELGPMLDQPFALFGHSLGAAVAFEFARRAQADRLRTPVRLIVSGSGAPDRTQTGPALSELDDAELLRTVVDLNGTHPALVTEPEAIRYILPTLRADFALNDSYRPVGGPKLTCPISVFLGDEDPAVDRASMSDWSDLTDDECSVHVFRGGHFYLEEDRPNVLSAVRGLLR